MTINPRAKEYLDLFAIVYEATIQTKETTEMIVTSENAKLLQNHVAILDRPSDIYKAIKPSRYFLS